MRETFNRICATPVYAIYFIGFPIAVMLFPYIIIIVLKNAFLFIKHLLVGVFKKNTNFEFDMCEWYINFLFKNGIDLPVFKNLSEYQEWFLKFASFWNDFAIWQNENGSYFSYIYILLFLFGLYAIFLTIKEEGIGAFFDFK
jgi:hypothetical protein